jgi:hypothetical protein
LNNHNQPSVEIVSVTFKYRIHNSTWYKTDLHFAPNTPCFVISISTQRKLILPTTNNHLFTYMRGISELIKPATIYLTVHHFKRVLTMLIRRTNYRTQQTAPRTNNLMNRQPTETEQRTSLEIGLGTLVRDRSERRSRAHLQ